jgi:hypothetical protein
MVAGRLADRKRKEQKRLNTHMHAGRLGKISSTGSAPFSVIRRVPRPGRKPRRVI